jgi:hypothetical protein
MMSSISVKKSNNNYLYHVLDSTTPWYEFLQYCEICHQLNVPGQPHVGRYMRYRSYLKEVGVL